MILARNPIQRFISFYQSTIAQTKSLGTKQRARNILKEFNRKIVGNETLKKFPLATYASNIEKRFSQHSNVNQHVSPMTDLCRPDVLHYSIFGTVDDIRNFSAQMRRIEPDFPKLRRANPSGRLQLNLSCATLSTLARAYREDFFWIRYYTGTDFLEALSYCFYRSYCSALFRKECNEALLEFQKVSV